MAPSCQELNSDEFPFFKIPPSTSRTRDSRGGIFTIKIPTFSGKTAEKVMGVYGIDCPAIFWDRECSTFWGMVQGVLEN